MTIHVAEHVISVPLDKLTLSPLNVRKRAASPSQDAELKATILSKGLQQNLVVIAGEEEGTFAVVAGGRRLKALQDLAAEGTIPADYAVRSIVVPMAEGAEHSLIENAVRANMHPAEEVLAFRDLILAQDWSFDAVAKRYGVSLRVVNQRMKLANVAPPILDAWRDGALTQSQVEAFALSDDPERQRAYFEDSSDWALKPDSIRKAMLQTALAIGRDRFATFVGREDYEAAGGAIVTDLFADHVYLEDAALVQELAQKKLTMLADEIVGREGWAWGRSAIEFSYREFEKHGRIYGKTAEDPEGEALRRTLLAAQGRYDVREAAITEACTDLQTGEIDEEAFEAAFEGDTELERISAEIEAADEALKAHAKVSMVIYDSAEKALAGVSLSVQHDGTLEIRRGLVHADQMPKLKELQERARIRERVIAARDQTGRATDEGDDSADHHDDDHLPGDRRDADIDGDDQGTAVSAEDEQAAINAEVEAELTRQREAAATRQQKEAEHAAEMKGDLSAALVGSLTLERTAALRATVTGRPDLALRLVAYQCALRTRQWPRDHAPVIGIEIRHMGLGAHHDGPAGKAYAEAVERLNAQLPDDTDQLFEHVMQASNEQLFAILAVGVAGTLDAHIAGPHESTRGKKRLADRIAQAAALDMSAWWQADEAFFARVAKGVMVEALREAAPMIAELPSEQAKQVALAELARMPKAELVKTTAQALEGTGWLPKPLRTPELNSGNGQSDVGNRDETAACRIDGHVGSNSDTFDPDPITELPPWLAADETVGDAEAEAGPAAQDAMDPDAMAAADAAPEAGTVDQAARDASDGSPDKPAAQPKVKAAKGAKATRKAKTGKPSASSRRKTQHANGAAGPT
ncbi:MAG: ParB/RepB/Spo0J family partition protein [Bosea sp. (in: a-proteobacteria)]